MAISWHPAFGCTVVGARQKCRAYDALTVYPLAKPAERDFGKLHLVYVRRGSTSAIPATAIFFYSKELPVTH